MFKSTFMLMAGIAALSGSIAFADSVSDRITVTLRGHGPDVVLIPGLTCSSAVWDTTAAHLEEHYRLHLVQINGFAGTSAQANAQGPVVQPTVDAIDAYIKAHQLKSPKVIGHSLGGTMGMMLALQHPEDVSSVMVVDALPFSGMLLGATDVDSAKKMATGLRDGIINESQSDYAQYEKQFIRSLVKSSTDRKTVTAWAIASDKSVVARALYEDTTTDLRPKLAEIKTPVTILYPWDSDSPYSQSQTDWFYGQNYQSLPNQTMVRIDSSCHFIMLDQPAAFMAQVDKFLK